jgi:starch synthase
MIKVLSVASECAPLVKTGGLADVAGALPGALADHGVTMRTLLPGYPSVMDALETAECVATRPGLFEGDARLLLARAAGLDLYVLDAPHLYDRPGSIYLGPDRQDWPDNPERFAALSLVAAEMAAAELGGWRPDVVHGHDWQAGLAPYYMKRHFASATPTILTIHNIAFHGLAPAEKLQGLMLNAADFTRDGFEFWNNINALKAGLVFADKLTTVSPTYAAELTRPDFGMGLDGVIRARAVDLRGILNGIDTGIWNPATDPDIAKPYKTARGKAVPKRALRAELGLPDADGPLCVVVSRLTEQKGLDLLLDALPALLDRGGQLALLGSGDAALERDFLALTDHPNVAVHIGYDEALSHRVIAGGDAIVIPSRFEPCGLTQLYGLRYGTIPLVALTGGLADTVINANAAALATGVATGLQVHPLTTDALAHGLIRLCELYADTPTWTRMQRRAMAQPVGWEVSAAAYADLYRDVLAA